MLSVFEKETITTESTDRSHTERPAAEPRVPIAAVLSNPFGVFAFEPVLPCSAYTVTARHRFFSFGAPAQIEPKDFPPDGSGLDIAVLVGNRK